MGVPFYGRTFITTLQGNIGDVAKDTQGFQGPYTRENGFMGYNEVRKLLKNNLKRGFNEFYSQFSDLFSTFKYNAQLAIVMAC